MVNPINPQVLNPSPKRINPKVWRLCFGVYAVGFGVYALGVEGSCFGGLCIGGKGSGVEGLWGLRFTVWGLGVWGLWFGLGFANLRVGVADALEFILPVEV